jgi:hypothetical protein
MRSDGRVAIQIRDLAAKDQIESRIRGLDADLSAESIVVDLPDSLVEIG